ncbi:MAG: hypothetical protein ACREA9_15070, partial [Pyrinomonadaceae bacterium]
IKTDLENNRREFLKSGATAAVGLGCLSLGLKAAPLITSQPQDRPRTHNMLVVGEQTVYLSHLPMFDGLNKKRTGFVSPHRFQVILEATFTDGNNNLTDLYTADRKSHPAEKMYTINPALFVLPDLDPKGKALRTFRGNTVFRGHLERESTPIIGFKEVASNEPPPAGIFDVNVRRVVHFHKFVPGAAKPTELQYILFGKGAETFLAHLIAQPPDFDQIVAVKVIGPMFSDDELSNGIKVSFPGTVNTGKSRIKEKQKASGVIQLPGTSVAKPVQFEVVKEFYFEEGELRVPAIFDPTAEEKKSGFFE